MSDWQPIETLDDVDRLVLMWTPRERLYTRGMIENDGDGLCRDDIRVSTRRDWTWATKWQPLPAPPQPDPSR